MRTRTTLREQQPRLAERAATPGEPATALAMIDGMCVGRMAGSGTTNQDQLQYARGPARFPCGLFSSVVNRTQSHLSMVLSGRLPRFTTVYTYSFPNSYLWQRVFVAPVLLQPWQEQKDGS